MKLEDLFSLAPTAPIELLADQARQADDTIGAARTLTQDPSLNLRFKEFREVTGNLANKLNHYLETPSLDSDLKLATEVSGRLVLQCRQADPDSVYLRVDPGQLSPFGTD